MVSGSDEHGTPITVTAETTGESPQSVVDRYHRINSDALLALGCAWQPNIDARGIEYGGALFNRTSDPEHKRYVQENFISLMEAGLFEKKTMQQYYEVREDGGRFLPDRYVEGICPNCDSDGARGDQCDECGTTYESHELMQPRSKMNPEAKIEIRDTDHLFYRLDKFQTPLEEHSRNRDPDRKANVRAMTKQWLDMGLRPRAVTRDLDWGISLPMDEDEWHGKCVYVWFEAVQGYYSCARIWSDRIAEGAGHSAGKSAWEKWWRISEEGVEPRHLYFLGKDNIPFHTVIWPAIIMGLNHAAAGKGIDDDTALPGPGDLQIEYNVPAMEYLMLAGGQFSKSRKHAVWLPSFLERFDPDTLRYYLSINMPENHDTDFNWPDFVEKVNNELNGTYGNYINRITSLANRLEGDIPLAQYENGELCNEEMAHLEKIHADIVNSLGLHRYKEALRHVMSAAQFGNQLMQQAAPWTHIKQPNDDEAVGSMAHLAFSWRIARFLAITTQPFLPFSAQRLWEMLGQPGEVSEAAWDSAIDWNVEMTWDRSKSAPLFQRLDLEEILAQETALVEENTNEPKDPGHGVKGSSRKNNGDDKMTEAPEGTTYIDFETFTSVDLRTGTITSVEEHPNADKLIVIGIDDGSPDGRTVCAGLKEYYSQDDLMGMSVVFVANLAPRELRGVLSNGMLLAADDGEGAVRLITVDGSISDGSTVR